MGGGGMHPHHLHLPSFHSKTSSFSPLPSLSYPSSSSSSSSCFNFPASSINTSPPFNQYSSSSGCLCSSGTCKELEALHVGNHDCKTTSGSSFDAVFGLVPSKPEVESAITSLQKFMSGISASGSEFNCRDVSTLLSAGYGRVREAFHMLQTEPYIKKLVVSLASDKAVWDAILNNDTVRTLRESFITAEDQTLSIRSYDEEEEEADLITCMLRWIMEVTKAKVAQLIDKLQMLLEEVFRPLERGNPTREEATHKVDDKITSSLLLSIVILLIVVLARAQHA